MRWQWICRLNISLSNICHVHIARLWYTRSLSNMRSCICCKLTLIKFHNQEEKNFYNIIINIYFSFVQNILFMYMNSDIIYVCATRVWRINRIYSIGWNEKGHIICSCVFFTCGKGEKLEKNTILGYFFLLFLPA